MDLIIPIYFVLSLLILPATVSIFHRKGYGSLWMLVPALIFGPLALLISLIMPIDPEGQRQIREQKESDRKAMVEHWVAAGAMRLCPHCGQGISPRASTCRYCRGEVEPTAVQESQGFTDVRSIDDAPVFWPILFIACLVISPFMQSPVWAITTGFLSIIGFVGMVIVNIPSGNGSR